MPRHRRPKPQPEPAAVLVICLDTYHCGEQGHAERGHHLVGELLRDLDGDGSGHLVWSGHAPERGPVRTPMITIAAPPAPGAPPVKRYRHSDDAPPPWRLQCPCGLDKQVAEADLAAFIAAWARKYPGQPCLIPLQRL
ncbi:MAG TPA: hypothetical protein VHZ03_14625 [Trebonia sp.]|jgi:hypothetical protein|nr:hypothetical protein [Trebonia sp.]